MLKRFTTVALGLLVAAGAIAAQPAAAAEVTLLNVSYDPTRELYEDYNKAFADLLEGQDRPDTVTISQSPRRLGQAGPLGDRRPGGRRRDPGAGLRHRCDREQRPSCCPPTGKRAADRTARPTPRRSCSWCARAIRRASRTGTIWCKPRRQGDHPEPEDFRRRALELPGGLGLCPEAAGRHRGQCARPSSASSTRTCRCSIPARAARPRPSCSAESATCCSRGRTRPIWPSRNSARASFDIVVSLGQHPGRAAGRAGGQGRRQAQDHARWPRPT